MSWAAYAIIAFILGVCFSAFISSKIVLTIYFVFVILLFIFTFRKMKPLAAAVVILLFVIGAAMYPVAEYKTRVLEKYFKSECVMMGKIVDISRSDNTIYTISLERIKNENYSMSFSGKIYAYCNSSNSLPLNHSDTVILRGTLTLPSLPMNFGDFNSRRYFRSIDVVAFCNDPEFIRYSSNSFSFNGFLNWLSEMSAGSLSKEIDGESADFISGVLLGDRSSFSKGLSENIRKAGVNHITAISGMHISILTSFLLAISNLFTRRRKSKAIFVILFLVFYMFLTGLSPSVVRAVIMSGCSLIGVIIGRRSNSLFMVTLAASIMLFINPFLLYNPSFMLSFISTGGLILFFPITKSYIKFSSPVTDTLFMTVISNIVTLPYILWNFHSFSWIGLAANLIIVPLIPFVFIGGGLSVVLGAIPVLGNAITNITGGITTLILSVINLTGSLPFGQLNYSLKNPFYLIAYILLLAFTYFKLTKASLKQLKLFPCIVVTLLFFGIFSDFSQKASFYINYLYVGQGDSALINVPGGDKFLIDTGDISESDSSKCLSALENQGVRKLKGIIISHIDSDHSGALFEIVKNIPTESIYLAENLINSGEANEIISIIGKEKIKGVKAGDTIAYKDVAFEFIYPPAHMPYISSNDNSLVVNISCHGNSFLFTGDISADTETYIASLVSDCDVLKVAHHGSKNSTTNAFLNEISPDIAVISSGINNKYYHPSGEVINRLNSKGVDTFVTSACGGVKITATKNGKLKIKTVLP